MPHRIDSLNLESSAVGEQGVPSLLKRLAHAIVKTPNVAKYEKHLASIAFSTILFDYDDVNGGSQEIQFAAYAYDLRKSSLHSLADRLEELQSSLVHASKECEIEDHSRSIYSVQGGLRRRTVRLDHINELVSMLLQLAGSSFSGGGASSTVKSTLLGTAAISRDPQMNLAGRAWSDPNSIEGQIVVPPFSVPDAIQSSSMPTHLCLDPHEQDLAWRIDAMPPSASSIPTARSLLFGGVARPSSTACDSLDVFLSLPLLPDVPAIAETASRLAWPSPAALRRVAAHGLFCLLLFPPPLSRYSPRR